jgi:mxaJ protein
MPIARPRSVLTLLVLLASGSWTAAQDCAAGPGHVARATSDPEAQGKPPRRVLRVSADPNNLPFTNDRMEGFENKIAELLARELDADLRYTWRAQRRGFFRSTLSEGECDLIMGVPSTSERALTTAPYYRSSYVFVTRKDREMTIRSFDDRALKGLKIGVQLIGDDGTNTPPAHALAARGLVDNLVGYTVYGDYEQENPPARIIDGVRKGEVDIAVVWGPLAGYFARRGGIELAIISAEPEQDRTGLPLAFDIALGVRKGDEKLKGQLDEILSRKRDEVGKILDDFDIPRASSPAKPAR